MEKETSQSEESHLIKNDDDDLDERCSSCFHFPKAVYFIIITELCERFNYYGMRTILILYLTQHLILREGNAVSVYHMFVSLCYFTTIIGSFISDNYLGKFKTLLIICSIYTFGSTLMSLTAIPERNLSGPLISLLLIALGTGGVKANVGPFGGDQIPPNKKVLLDSFFSMFYFAINLGALLSTILTPILRADVACNGSDDCYPLAFGVPAILMAVALVIFVLGRQYYVESPVRENVYIKAIGCVFISIKRWYRERRETPKKELLDYASGEYDAAFISDLRTLFRIAILYLPLPIYWALYEQMGSRWTLQAAQLDGELTRGLFILPDQMSLMNVILVMMLIPIFDSCIYPISYKISPKLKPLRRMTVGIGFTCLSFLAAFILQTQIEMHMTPKISPGYSRLMFVNTKSCDLSIKLSDGRSLFAKAYRSSNYPIDLVGQIQKVELTYSQCNFLQNSVSMNATLNLVPQQINFLLIGVNSNNQITYSIIRDFHSVNRKGHPLIKLVAPLSLFAGYNFRFKIGDQIIQNFVAVSNSSSDYYYSNWTAVPKPGRYTVDSKAPTKVNGTSQRLGVLLSNEGSLDAEPIKIVSSEVVIFLVTLSDPERAVILIPLTINNGSTISIMWQIPQYVLISIGEVLVSITGLCFSYDQAPEGMKALVNAFWYLSNAFGNILVMIVAKLQLFEYLSWEYLTFAGICLVFNCVFAALAYYYRMSKHNEYEKMLEITPEVGVE